MVQKERECGHMMFMSQTWLPPLSTTDGEQRISER